MGERAGGRKLFLGLSMVAASAVGCGVSGPRQLQPENFLQPPPPLPSSPDLRVDARRMPNDDRPGALSSDPSRIDPADSGGILTVPGQKPDQSSEVNGVSETVRENVRTPGEVAALRAQQSGAKTSTPLPTTSPTPGEYMMLGAVVVTVNGDPIYANKVLSDITPVLAVKARDEDSQAFQETVQEEVVKQLSVLIRTELEFAAAERNLDSHDRDLAKKLTEQWRQEQVTRSGGSVEQARAQARADGRDFDDLVTEQFRVEMRRIYFQKKEYPKVQVTADDMRQYYAKHEDQIFTERAQAKFRLIKISIEASGGRDAALAKINGLRDRAAKGEDFATIAGTTNDDAALLTAKGDAGFGDWVERGAFANEMVDQAVWKLNPGQMSPVIEEPTAFYLVKLDEKKDGKVRAFEDPDVQALIKRALEAEQFVALRDNASAQLQKESIINPYPPKVEPVMEMAMQMYPRWRK